MRGQLSAEMLILITVVLAIVAIAASQLLTTAKDTGEQISEQSSTLADRTGAAMKAGPGEFCVTAEDCREGLDCGTDSKCG